MKNEEIKDDGIESIEKNSKIVSESLRKIVITLMLTVFGLAYQDRTFIFESWKLKFSIILFVCYYAIDMFQYVFNMWSLINNRKNRINRQFNLFIFKLIVAMAGLTLILFEILDR